jgi:hypothetical protein
MHSDPKVIARTRMLMRRLTPLLAIFVAFSVRPVMAEDPIPTIGPRDLVIDGERVHVILPPGRIAPVDDPIFLSAAAADAVFADDEPIVGVVLDGEAHAYSLWHLDRHEVVNDQLGGRAIAATW